MQDLPDGTQISRAPKDMQSWEIIGTYRHAWALAVYAPSGYLAKALANWTSAARHELERRGEWHPEKLPPYSMWMDTDGTWGTRSLAPAPARDALLVSR